MLIKFGKKMFLPVRMQFVCHTQTTIQNSKVKIPKFQGKSQNRIENQSTVNILSALITLRLCVKKNRDT
ncbi:MAG: hypothetical protein BGO56_14835 [Sphingobacteriales bacterium 48-107]|nr:MAG: hypothetical protein BGO56_14835 [Sphingobacteriales bacterium 48-107]